LPKAASDDEQFAQLKTWLASYKPEDSFDEKEGNKIIKDAALKILPSSPSKRLGQIKYAWPDYAPLNLPEKWQQFAQAAGEESSPMRASTFYVCA